MQQRDRRVAAPLAMTNWVRVSVQEVLLLGEPDVEIIEVAEEE